MMRCIKIANRKNMILCDIYAEEKNPIVQLINVLFFFFAVLKMKFLTRFTSTLLKVSSWTSRVSPLATFFTFGVVIFGTSVGTEIVGKVTPADGIRSKKRKNFE